MRLEEDGKPHLSVQMPDGGPDGVAYFMNAVGIEPVGGFIQIEQFPVGQERLGQCQACVPWESPGVPEADGESERGDFRPVKPTCRRIPLAVNSDPNMLRGL